MGLRDLAGVPCELFHLDSHIDFISLLAPRAKSRVVCHFRDTDDDALLKEATF